ncbi:MAG: PDDEXK nuclease domain-containing protein [Gammaproteobacteria bacterium]|nr:PDDEXK nuclease domain-containing protein [Gammaproteobacteria bacterium]MCF6362845.1 PDDEXK nuclease domain-containing protein [Gammaproteobacteria bacterium]
MNTPPAIPQQLLTDISQILDQSRHHIQRTVNAGMVQAYWHVGRLIVEHEQQGAERAEYGKQQLEQLASALQGEFGKGFDVSNLRNMRRFYLAFPIQDALRPELSWTHYRSLIRIESGQARQWYLNEAVEQNWSARALDRQISALYYERLLTSTARQPVEQEARQQTQPLQVSPKDYLRDPYILDFLNLPHQSLLESQVEQALIDNLQQFLLELGKGFAFVARQQRISCEDQDFYVDLVFYNFKLKCFLLVDLKLGKLNHQDVGQMDTYVRIYDEQRRGDDDNPTIGLILCSEKSEAVAKYSVLTESKQLFASKYLPYLPSEEELREELKRERQLIQVQQHLNQDK